MRALLEPTLMLVCAAGSAAQTVVWQRVGTLPPEYGYLAGPVAVIGDVNGDGYDDVVQAVFAITMIPADPIYYDTEDQLRIYSGRDGKLLRLVHTRGKDYGYYTVAAAGDVDGDGVRDYAVTIVDGRYSRQTNYVQVRSGRDDHVLYEVPGSWFLVHGARSSVPQYAATST